MECILSVIFVSIVYFTGLYLGKNLFSGVDKVSDRVDRLSKDINLILDYLDVIKQGELDKDVLGWGRSPENAVVVKLVKNKK